MVDAESNKQLGAAAIAGAIFDLEIFRRAAQRWPVANSFDLEAYHQKLPANARSNFVNTVTGAQEAYLFFTSFRWRRMYEHWCMCCDASPVALEQHVRETYAPEARILGLI